MYFILKLLTQITGLASGLLLLVACDSPQSTPKSITFLTKQIPFPSAATAKVKTVATAPTTLLPTAKLNSTFVVLQWGQLRVVLIDKDRRQDILGRSGLFRDRFITDTEAQFYEGQKCMDETEPETDSLKTFLLTGVN
jgi:hypothetical protein